MRCSSLVISLMVNLWVCAFAPFANSPTHQPTNSPTLVVESVSPDSPAAKAGVKVGDRLLTYDGKPLPSPAALLAAQQNTFGKKEIALQLQRGSEPLTLTVPLGTLGIGVRPELPPDVLKLYEQGNPSRDGDGAVALWTQAAKAAQEAGDKAAAAWLYGRVGEIYESQRKWQEARLVHAAAWELLKPLTPSPSPVKGRGEQVDAAAQSRTLSALGRCSRNLNDFPAAQGWYEQARQVDEAAGNEMWAAGDLNDSGVASYYRGDLNATQDYWTCALKIRERLAPDSLDVADSLNNLGNVADERGDLSAAHDYHTRALKIQERLAPDSLDVAGSLNNLGIVAKERGDLSAAQDYYTRALNIQERLAPDSLAVAASLNNLGEVARQRGDLSAAQDYYTRAVALVEAQRRQIASTEERALLVEQYTQPYTGLLQTYLARNDLPAAFTTLEHAHARSLVELLNKRQLAFHADAPADLLKQQDTLEYQRAAVYRQLAKLDPRLDDEKRGQLVSQLASCTTQQQTLAKQIRDAAPKFADLQYPQPLDFKGAQAALDAGTLLLAYYVDEKETYLFVVKGKEGEGRGRKGKEGEAKGSKGKEGDASPLPPRTLASATPSPLQSIQLFRLKVKGAELRERVEMFRLAVAHQGVFRHRGRALYDLLVRPAQSLVDKAQRVLICPDGPLHTLPFAALVVSEKEKGKGKKEKVMSRQQPTERYFVEMKPLHTIVSMTVYAEVRKQAQSSHTPTLSYSHTPTLLALGDPQYDAVPDKVKQEARTRGMDLTPLPNTRKEVEAIGRLYGKQARVRVGKDASETAAKQESGGAKVLHFACHGVLDNREPLASALALAPSGGTRSDASVRDKGQGTSNARNTHPSSLIPHPSSEEDGLLQAYEIFESVRFNADLVVMSACETGLGGEMKNEGIVGMTRAFQYAGAKSVVVSLWKIADESTSRLMMEFYKGLAGLRVGGLVNGKRRQLTNSPTQQLSKDEALRLAQLKLMKDGKHAHPFYWAPFVLAGDWR